MISVGSCDTEDWSNDAENTALITGINDILTYIHIENCYFKIAIIFHKSTLFFFIFYQIHTALLSIRNFLKKKNIKKSYWSQTFEQRIWVSVYFQLTFFFWK